MVKHLSTMQETWVQSLGREDLLEKEMQPTPVFLPGKSHGQRSLVGYGVEKSWTQLSDFTSLSVHFLGPPHISFAVTYFSFSLANLECLPFNSEFLAFVASGCPFTLTALPFWGWFLNLLLLCVFVFSGNHIFRSLKTGIFILFLFFPVYTWHRVSQ